ncbi:WXG100 family type VII secretion target [Streptomyces pinistramenti]|uniref:WXG100 family type VII secretion target n=1 Tax=Streptomyces pinistramenti TaxID=2884812 RepID=UPI001D066ABB|nr:WXG100 family type VII secretion target [Streptomyces pinistramenti]MCB5909026.1 WXG100 family type VII secretion target [Streptomyces pinistramenti]
MPGSGSFADFSANHGVMDNTRQELVNYTIQIENYLEELSRQVMTVRGEMDGLTIDAYNTAHQQWMAKVDDMRETLGMGHKTLMQVAQNYQQVDGDQNKQWQNTTV